LIQSLFVLESGAPAGAEGRFLKKAPQKLFSRGQLGIASFSAEKLCFSAENDLDSARSCVLGEICEGLFSDFGGEPSPPLQKFFAELFFKKATTPRPQAH